MPRFNFNEIAMSGKADISKIQENFEEIEENGITEAEVDAKVGGQDNFFEKTVTYDIPSEATILMSECYIRIFRRGKFVTMCLRHNIGKSVTESASYTSRYQHQKILNFNEFADWLKPSKEFLEEGQLDFGPFTNLADYQETDFPGSAYCKPWLYIETNSTHTAYTKLELYITYNLPHYADNDGEGWEFENWITYPVD